MRAETPHRGVTWPGTEVGVVEPALHARRAGRAFVLPVRIRRTTLYTTHLHAAGRRRDDPAWHGVVWGVELPEKSWSDAQLDELRRVLRKAIDLES